MADHLNHRHRMAQFAGRASTDLHAHVFFKDRVAEEEAYVMRVRKNGVVVMLPRLGLEAPVIFAGDSGYELDRDAMGLTSPAAKAKRIRVLDRVRVRIEVIDHLLLLGVWCNRGVSDKGACWTGSGACRVALRHARAHARAHTHRRHRCVRCSINRNDVCTCQCTRPSAARRANVCLASVFLACVGGQAPVRRCIDTHIHTYRCRRVWGTCTCVCRGAFVEIYGHAHITHTHTGAVCGDILTCTHRLTLIQVQTSVAHRANLKLTLLEVYGGLYSDAVDQLGGKRVRGDEEGVHLQKTKKVKGGRAR